MDAAHAASVERFVFLGSSCIYPRDCPQPIKEEYLMTGPLERTNSAYAVAKISGIELIKSYRKQHGRHWISLMPTNIYGPRDNFNLETSHVIPALVNRFVTAQSQGTSKVTLWGTGKPKREFLHSNDLSKAIIFALEKYDLDEHLNVGTGEDMSILELAELIAKESGFAGEIVWDSSKPDGTPRKVLDISRIKALGWSPSVGIAEGVRETITWYRENQSKVRA
jgi:GDP-L-fucose synthase